MALPDYNEQTILILAAELPPAEAVAFFREKGFKITWDWRETLNDANNATFQVAKSMNMGVLQDIRKMVDKAIADGLTFKQFQLELEPLLVKRGWWGSQIVEGERVQLGSLHRLNTIYQTNTQSAYNAGRWEVQSRDKRRRPFLRLNEVLDASTRTTHRRMSGSIAKVTSKFWNRWYPPNGFNSFVPDTEMAGTIEGATRRLYSGKVITIETAEGRRLTVTPNHPIPTDTGFVAAGNILEDQKVFCYSGSTEMMNSGFPGGPAKENNNIPARIQEIFDFFIKIGSLQSANVGPHDFHGDTFGGNGEIDVINVDSELLDNFKEFRGYEFPNLFLEPTDPGSCSHLTVGVPEFFLERFFAASGSRPRTATLSHHGRSILFNFAPFKALTLRGSSQDYPVFPECSFNDLSAYSIFFRQLTNRFPGIIETDEVVAITESDFSGHVYDLQTNNGLIIANGLIVSNCRGRTQSLTEKQAKAFGIGIKGREQPDAGFSGNPGIKIFQPKKSDFDNDLFNESKKMDPLF